MTRNFRSRDSVVRHMLVLSLVAALAACSPTRTFRNTIDPPLSWDFIQSVGGIAVGQPRVVDGVFWLPLEMDLSGMRHITREPTLHNTGVKCTFVTLHQADKFTTPPGYYNLHLQVHGGPPDKRGEGSCEEVPLFIGDLTPPLANPERMNFRIWYSGHMFSQHLIDEVRLQ